MHRKVISINNQGRFALLLAMSGLLLGVLMACSGGMSDDEKEIAVAIGLTQTAAALEQNATPTAAATPVPPTIVPPATVVTESVAAPMATPVDTPTVAAEVTTATAATTTITTTEAAALPTVDLLAAGAALPVTQNSAKVRTLLVAPGEPGRLYALLTDATDDTAPAASAQLLISDDFGQSWALAPSGLPVAADCLLTINMDYYGATALYASTCEGLYRWAEGESDWSLVSSEQTGMVAIVYGSANLIWATRPVGVEGAPLLISQNGGQSWNEAELEQTNGVAMVGISPRDSQTGYAIVRPGSEGSALRRGTMLSNWRVMPSPQDALPLNGGLTIDGGTGWLYVTTREADGDRLWRSADADTPLIEDVSWTEVYRFAPGDQVELLASGWSSEEDQLAIYANLLRTVDGTIQSTLIRSLDSGQSWAPLVVDAG